MFFSKPKVLQELPQIGPRFVQKKTHATFLPNHLHTELSGVLLISAQESTWM